MKISGEKKQDENYWFNLLKITNSLRKKNSLQIFKIFLKIFQKKNKIKWLIIILNSILKFKKIKNRSRLLLNI